MKVFRFLPPYLNNGKTRFPEAKDRAGIYIIKENGTIVYVGYSENNLYRTIYRHFQAWTDIKYKGDKALPPEIRVSYKDRMKRNTYTVRIVFCKPGQASRLEKMLIMKYAPRDNTNKYESYQINQADSAALVSYEISPVETEVPF